MEDIVLEFFYGR